MKCRIARRLISSFLDDALDGDREQAFVSHVQRCGGCRQLLEEARLARDALHGFVADDMDVPENLSARIKGAIRQAEEDTKLIEKSSTPAIGSPAFIATCASLFIGAVMFYVVTTKVYVQSSLDAHERSTSLAADMARLRSGSPARLAQAAAAPTAGDPDLALLAKSSETGEEASAPAVASGPDAAPDMFQSLTARASGADLSALATPTPSPATRRRHVWPTPPAHARRPVASAASREEESAAGDASECDALAAAEDEEVEVRQASIVDAKVPTRTIRVAHEEEPEEAEALSSVDVDITETIDAPSFPRNQLSCFLARPGWEADGDAYVTAPAGPLEESPTRRGSASH